MPIHPTAIVDKQAELDSSAEIGAYAIVEAGVRIGPRTRVYSHAYISQGARIGADCQIHPFAVVGHHPQDLGWKQTPSYADIGDGTIVREHVTIHRGTPPETATVVGQRCFLMSTAHVGHNSVLGDDVKMASGAVLAGWVQVGRATFISGNAGVHQFVRIGELVMIGGIMRVTTDIPPFMLVGPEGPQAPNVIGLRRAGFSAAERDEIRLVYRLLYRRGLPFSEALAQVAATVKTPPGLRMVEFLRGPSKRGIARLRRRSRDAEPDADDAP